MQNHIACLIQACQTLNINYEFVDKDKNFVKVLIGDTHHYFHANRTPFNTEAVAGICKDKDHTYQLLSNTVRMPKTLAFLDFRVDKHYQRYVIYKSMEAILEQIDAHLSYPIIIKRNRGCLGRNVFLCETPKQATEAIEAVFDNSKVYYDYIALAQEYIPSVKEFRFVCFAKEPVLAYERYLAGTSFKASYWNAPQGSAIDVDDPKLIEELLEFVLPVYQVLDIGFVGFDIVRSQEGSLYLLELNSGPRFDHFVQFNGREKVIAMYQTILNRLSQNVL